MVNSECSPDRLQTQAIKHKNVTYLNISPALHTRPSSRRKVSRATATANSPASTIDTAASLRANRSFVGTKSPHALKLNNRSRWQR